MNNLKSLYHNLILDHGRNPRNFRVVEKASHTETGHNPLCGDCIELSLLIEDETIVDIGFTGKGCAICMASTSIMTEEVKGKSLKEAGELQAKFKDMLLSESSIEVPDSFKVFLGVKQSPMRAKCALLPWYTLLAALKNTDR